MLLIFPATCKKEIDHVEYKRCLPGASRPLPMVSLRCWKQSKPGVILWKAGVLRNGYQLDLAQRLGWTGSASRFMVNVKGWLRVLVTVFVSGADHFQGYITLFSACLRLESGCLMDKNETAYICSERRCRDDVKGSELICIANSGLKVVITYAIINHEPSLGFFPPLVLMKNKVVLVFLEISNAMQAVICLTNTLQHCLG